MVKLIFPKQKRSSERVILNVYLRGNSLCFKRIVRSYLISKASYTPFSDIRFAVYKDTSEVFFTRIYFRIITILNLGGIVPKMNLIKSFYFVLRRVINSRNN